MNKSLQGNESGLVTYLRLEEGSGPITADEAVLGNTGTLTNGPLWVTSTAPLASPPPSGDVDGDSRLTILDVVQLVRIIVGLDTSPSSGSDTFVRADANNDEALNVLDVILILDGVLNVTVKPNPPPSLQVASVVLNQSYPLPTGHAVLPVSLRSGNPIAGFQFTLNFDPSGVTLGTPVLTGATADMEIQTRLTAGRLHVIVYSTDGRAIPPGAANLVLVPLNTKSGARAVSLSGVILADADARSVPVTLLGGARRQASAHAPVSYALHEAAPNPFNPATTISYDVPFNSRVRITVYNVLGQMVDTLVDREHTAGTHKAVWQGRNRAGASVGSGVYIYRLTSEDGFESTRRMLLLK